MELSRSVLVVVDMQNYFVNDRARHVVPVIADLVRRWQSTGGAVIFTRYWNYPGSQFERLIGWTRMQAEPETTVIEELQPYLKEATAVVDKHSYTLFSDGGAEVIEEGGWQNLVICGIATESCVCKTAVDAFERGLTPWVLTDASASHAGPATHDAGLLVTSRFIGAKQLVSSTTVTTQVLAAPA
jgi:nicotinamidase-related amidase